VREVGVSQQRCRLRLHDRGRVDEAAVVRARENRTGFSGRGFDGRLLRFGLQIEYPAVAADPDASRIARAHAVQSARRKRGEPGIDPV
jgi:hypothetical protein